MDVKFDIKDGVAVIQLDDGKKNAITPDAGDSILAALDEAEASADAIVLAGRWLSCRLLPTLATSWFRANRRWRLCLPVSMT